MCDYLLTLPANRALTLQDVRYAGRDAPYLVSLSLQTKDWKPLYSGPQNMSLLDHERCRRVPLLIDHQSLSSELEAGNDSSKQGIDGGR